VNFKSGQQYYICFSVALEMCYFLRKYFLSVSSDGIIMGQVLKTELKLLEFF